MMTPLVWQATSCQATPSLYLLLCTARQASSWYSWRPSMVRPMSFSVSMVPSRRPSALSGWRRSSPVWDQYVLSDGWLVGGILPFPAPAQNHPLVLMGWRWSASQPLPLKLHFRPEVHTTETLSALTTEAISLYSSSESKLTRSMHRSRQKLRPLNQSQSSNLCQGSLQDRK